MGFVRKIVRKAMKFFINLDYNLDPERSVRISTSLGTKYDDHDFTLIVNRYSVQEEYHYGTH